MVEKNNKYIVTYKMDALKIVVYNPFKESFDGKKKKLIF